MELKLKDILKNRAGAVVTLWHAKENAILVKRQDLFEITTDKATFDVECPVDGVLKKIYKKAGDKVTSEDTLAEIIVK